MEPVSSLARNLSGGRDDENDELSEYEEDNWILLDELQQMEDIPLSISEEPVKLFRYWYK